MAKPSQKGNMPSKNKGAYKSYDNEKDDGAMASNERALRGSVGNTTNVSKPGTHSARGQEQPSKAMAKGNPAP